MAARMESTGMHFYRTSRNFRVSLEMSLKNFSLIFLPLNIYISVIDIDIKKGLLMEILHIKRIYSKAVTQILYSSSCNSIETLNLLLRAVLFIIRYIICFLMNRMILMMFNWKYFKPLKVQLVLAPSSYPSIILNSICI